MDSQSLAVMALPGTGEEGSVRCDQAVFTSVRTSTGQGYRIIAASRGLTPQEKSEISARSPSHAGLCDESDAARAASFHTLKSGRLCAAVSRAAGFEQTGRGGQRIYTRVAVFDAPAMARFGHNPFNVLRAMERQHLHQPELELPALLPPLMLPATGAMQRSEWPAAAAIGPCWLSYLLHAAMSNRSLILAGDGNLDDALEAVILAIPAPLRKRVSFSQGLKFSIGRAFTFNEISGDTTPAERIIRGHAIKLVRPGSAAPPSAQLGAWEMMAEEAWSEEEFGGLDEFATLPFTECDRETLDHIAELRNEANRASLMDAAELLTLADRRLNRPETGAIESQLVAELLATIEIRLGQIWADAPGPDLQATWPTVRTLVRKSPAASRYALPLAGALMRRLAAEAPLAALDAALDLARESQLQVINSELRTVLRATEEWGRTADPSEVRSAVEKLNRWRRLFPQIGHIGDAIEKLMPRAAGTRD